MACVRFLLALPVPLSTPSVLGGALQAALVYGRSHLPAAASAVDALERWQRVRPSALDPILKDTLPLLGQLLVTAKATETITGLQNVVPGCVVAVCRLSALLLQGHSAYPRFVCCEVTSPGLFCCGTSPNSIPFAAHVLSLVLEPALCAEMEVPLPASVMCVCTGQEQGTCKEAWTCPVHRRLCPPRGLQHGQAAQESHQVRCQEPVRLQRVPRRVPPSGRGRARGVRRGFRAAPGGSGALCAAVVIDGGGG